MDNSQVAHVWAQQKKATGKGSNFFFDGAYIYSYGRHYVAGRFTDKFDASGCRIVLVNSTRYSVTTARHVSYVRQALHGLAVSVIEVERPEDDDPRHNLAAMVAARNAKLEKAATARTYTALHINYADRIERDARIYARAFGADVPEFAPFDRDAIRARIAQQANAQREATAAREKANREAYQAAIADWRAHRVDYVPFIYETRAALRLSLDGASIETSRRASVPVRVAPVLWRIACDARASGEAREFSRDDRAAKVGHFQLTRADADGSLVIGCHTIAFDELQRMAQTLGYETARDSVAA
jgi:hypothetical protein